MPLLSTVPQKAGGAAADVQKCVPTLSDKATALAKTNADSGVILSTEEIKVTAGSTNGEVKISVPRFLGQSAKKLGAPPGLESGLSKPPGIHFAPPPGLSRQPMKVTEPDSSSLSGLPPPLPLPPSPASISPSSSDGDLNRLVEEKEAGLSDDGDNSTADDEQQAKAETDCKPLPTLLGSTPMSSLLGSAPLYGKSIIDKFTSASKADKLEPARAAEVTPS
mmetsp:Transcript_28861/g.54104  ORF Transcript_28861/g.54104 Transcript_28861/m.54104 type:complete len:221 (+) Transcript_28861:143-805(+)